jgi:hypothetical protein
MSGDEGSVMPMLVRSPAIFAGASLDIDGLPPQKFANDAPISA